MTALQDLDPEQRLVDVLNGGALALMLSIGHRLGLLDALGRAGGLTASDLASGTGCDDRYVREWLGALTCGGIVEVAGEPARYSLVDGAADLLTRTGPANLAVFMQYVAVLGSVEDGIVECFKRGGGLGYEHFPRFHAVMAEDSAQTVLAALDGMILPLVPGLSDRLQRGIDVLDVGCGSGRALVQLARMYPESRFLGVDLVPDAIATATDGARGLPNVRFEVLDAADLDSVLGLARFDLVLSFDAIHDQAQPARMLRGIRTVLRDDGVYLAQDIASSGSHRGDVDHPVGTFLYAISLMHCMTVSLAADGAGLGAMWGVPAAQRYLADAGFSSVATHRLEHDFQNVYYVCRA